MNEESISPAPTNDSTFELGKLHFERCDLLESLPHLLEASAGYRQDRNFEKFLKAKNMILRIYAEQENLEAISKVKEEIQDLVLKEGLELGSKTYYLLALCASYRGQIDSAHEYIHKALSVALATDNKEDICYAIAGRALIFRLMGKPTEALKEIYNLKVFFEVLDVPEVRISSEILNAGIHLELNRPQEATEILWQVYEFVKQSKSMFMYMYVLFYMGRAAVAAGDKDLGRMYLNLASKGIDEKNLPKLAALINGELEQVSDVSSSSFDMVFNLDDHTVVEKKLGKIDFKNQFILLDLLKLFVQNQGQVYSKESLVEKVWKQDYDPSVHDNKIYVTIKRLRKMIEPDFDKPKYIFRAKNGYFMNKSARVYMEIRGEH